MSNYAGKREYGYDAKRYKAILEGRIRRQNRSVLLRCLLIIGIALATAIVAGLIIYVYQKYGIAI